MSRIWIDTTTMSLVSVSEAKSLLQKLIDAGHTLVIANTAVDVELFQKEPDWFEEQLYQHKIIIEIWATPDEMVKKAFFWSSMGVETPAAESLEEAVADWIESDAIIHVAELVNYYGLPRGAWACGTYTPPTPLSQETADKLGVPITATRTEVLAAAKAGNFLAVYDEYNVAYNAALARQHYCTSVVTTSGYKEI